MLIGFPPQRGEPRRGRRVFAIRKSEVSDSEAVMRASNNWSSRLGFGRRRRLVEVEGKNEGVAQVKLREGKCALVSA